MQNPLKNVLYYFIHATSVFDFFKATQCHFLDKDS